MALQGKVMVKGASVPDAFIQIFQMTITPPYSVHGQGRIFANREEADKSIQNHLEHFVVMGVTDDRDPLDTLYAEVLKQERFKQLSYTEDVDLIPVDSDEYKTFVLRAPNGIGNN